MMLAPDNFLYFIAIFTISIFGGTYILYSYYRNRLLILNVLLFYICGAIACAEYYLPQVDSFTTATNIGIFHSMLSIIYGACLWSCIWLYIRPFRGFKREKIINFFYLVGIIAPLLVGGLYGFYYRLIYYFNPEKIGGYWLSTVNADFLITKIFLFQCVITMNLIVVALFLIAIFRDRKDMFRLTLLLIFRVLSPIIYYTSVTTISEGKWNVPSIALMLLVECLITSWFVSNYRIFRNSFYSASSDLLNSISDLAISTDTNLLISNANNKANTFFLDIQQGNSIIDTLTKNSALTLKQASDQIKNLIQGKMDKVELSIINTQEVERVLEMKASPFKKNEQIKGYTFLMTDLSEIRQKERELQSLNETKDRLFAILSHDLRRSALAFRGISKKVNRLISKQEFEKLNKFGTHIEREAFSLNSLLDNLLNWVLQQQEILSYDAKAWNVKEVIDGIYESFQSIAENKGVTLAMNIDASCAILSDLNGFKSIIRNLVDNAIKYTFVGGIVEITAIKKGAQVLIKVADTGMGIELDHIDTIFDLKKNKSRQGTEGEMGTGLGLSLVRDLVRQNKGTITVSSQRNEGTTFEVLLPAGKMV